jgi:putative DNA primase/helicase
MDIIQYSSATASAHLDLRSVARALGGELVSGNRILAPGPNHSSKDRSLLITVDSAAPDGFRVHSFANDDWRACRDHVRARLGLPQWQGLRRRLARLKTIERTKNRESDWNAERARVIWSEGQDPRGTLAEEYLAARKLNLPAELCGPILRFHPQCPWRSGDKVESIPCLIAAFTSISDNSVTGIHRIRLDRSECWPKVERKMLGGIRGSAVMLDPAKERLAVAEGIESALAARQLGFGATWALGSAREFAPIDGVYELVILGEGDAASRKAAEGCARLWQDQGRAVSLAVPATGGDFNDLLMVTR